MSIGYTKLNQTMHGAKGGSRLPMMHQTRIWRKDDSNALRSHVESAHGGMIDPNCPACREIQERYPESVFRVEGPK